MASIKEFVLETFAEDPRITNEELAALCRKQFPGSSTTAASVSSIKSTARRSGELEQTELAVIDTQFDLEVIEDDDGEDEITIGERIKKRFAAMMRMANGVMTGIVPALIVSGPPGLGKSFGIREAIKIRTDKAYLDGEEEFTHDYISGAVSPVGLYIALWNQREGGLVVLDDCDDAFKDETSLNLLKTVLDSNAVREVSWRKQSRWLVDLGIDPQFEFKGSVIFLTNLDFERYIEKGNAMGTHFKALMDRCLYLHLTIRTIKDCMVRIKQVIYEEKMLEQYNMVDKDIDSVVDYVYRNRKRFYHLSLRLVHQIALCQKSDAENWVDDISMTKMRAYTEDMEEPMSETPLHTYDENGKRIVVESEEEETTTNGKNNGSKRTKTSGQTA
jgi:hypothetical protein